MRFCLLPGGSILITNVPGNQASPSSLIVTTPVVHQTAEAIAGHGSGLHGYSRSRTSANSALSAAPGLLRMLPATMLLLSTFGCSCRLNLPAPIGLIKTEASMVLDGHQFDLRLSKPPGAAAANVLIIYATGDGGWLGLGGDVYKWLASWNYPIAGFSSRGYIHNLGLSSDTETTTPRRLARDYESIIAFAEARLGLPSSTPIILVGLSRGAGFAVVAAGEGSLDQRVAGLLTIALTKEEEHVMRNRTPNARATKDAPKRLQVMIQTYTYLNRIGSIPLMVLQSTNDGYLPADAARELFGPDTALRRLRAIPASNHAFSGGCQTLYQDTKDALKWMTGFLATQKK